MASRESSDLAARADVLGVAQGAVLLLRARRKAGVVGEDLASDVDFLLTAASSSSSRQTPKPFPRRCADAVVRLAGALVQRCADSRFAWRRRRGCAGGTPPRDDIAGLIKRR